MISRKHYNVAGIDVTPVSIAQFTLMFVALAVHPRAITAAYFALIAWSLTGTRQALQAITLSAVIRFLNPALFVKPADVTMLSYMLVVAAGVRPLMSFTVASTKIILPLAAFILIAAAGSLQNSNMVSVSLLKLASFSFTFGITIIGFLSLNQDEVSAFKNWLFQLLLTVTMLSAMIFLVPGAGYKRTAEGFQGLLSHPQALGVFLAPLASYFFAHLLTESKKHKARVLLILISVLMIIFFSHTRTGILSIMLALSASLALGSGFIDEAAGFSRKQVWTAFGLIAVGMAAVYFSIPEVKTTTESFLLKGKGTTVYESFQLSRGREISAQIENFSDKPIMGNGFGVYAADTVIQRVSTVGGMPISASVEKGFLPTAVLEETGLLGTAAFVVFLGALLRQVIHMQNFSALCLFFSSIFVNFGEMVFFSVNGLGSFFWILIGLSCVDRKTVIEPRAAEAEHSHLPVTSSHEAKPSPLLPGLTRRRRPNLRMRIPKKALKTVSPGNRPAYLHLQKGFSRPKIERPKFDAVRKRLIGKRRLDPRIHIPDKALKLAAPGKRHAAPDLLKRLLRSRKRASNRNLHRIL